MNKCKFENCDKPVIAKQMCHHHYHYSYRTGLHKAKLREKRRVLSDEEHKARRRKYYLTGRAKYPHRYGEYQRKQRTGFTPETFNNKLAEQGNVCDICRRPFSQNLKPYADHCHNTKQQRGILCHHCNAAEGFILKTGLSPEYFCAALAAYLKKYHG